LRPGGRSPGIDPLEGRLFAPINETFADPTIHAKNQIEGVGTKPRDLHNLIYALGIKPP
jgi:hypothetical protein